MRDYSPGNIVDLKFNTHDADGDPITLAGTPAISVYKDNSTTESTSGVTLTVDLDSRTGMHHVRIDTSADGTFYSTGSHFYVTLTAGTVDGKSVIGVVVGEFTLGRQTVPMIYPVGAVPTEGINENGQAQGISATTITLRAAFAGGADVVVGSICHIVSATTGALQSGYCTDYDNVSKVATIAAGWSGGITPTGTIMYMFYASPPVDAAGIRAALGMASANMDSQFTGVLARLPAALVSGRIDASVGAMGASVITAASIAADAITAAKLAADVATEITAAAMAILNRLDTALEADGPVFRFTANALELAPAGGGGGSADWNTDERTAIRSILGVPGAGTTPADPSVGILDTIRDLLVNVQSRLPSALTNGSINSNITHVIGNQVQNSGNTTTNWGGAP